MATRARPDRVWIRDEWLDLTIRHPDAEQVQQDGRIRRWKRIEGADGRCLRVILLEDVLLDVNKDGHIVNMTVERATKQTNVNEFSYQLAAIA
ncbi:MAG: hypothetical protein WCK89_10355 [bacterium]